MARPRNPWYRAARNDWLVMIDGRQEPLGPHPAGAGPPRRGKPKPGRKTGDWVVPEAVRKEYFRKMSERDKPDDGAAPKGTVAALAGRFLAWTEKHKAPATYAQRRYFLRSFVNFGRVRLTQPHRVTDDLVERWLDAHPGWKASRRHAVLCVLRAFNWAVKKKLLAKNPVGGIEVPPPTRVLAYLTADQRAALFAATKDRAFKDFLTALSETGCRPGEVAAVTAADADLGRGLWVLAAHKTGRKTGKPRVVFLTDAMLGLTRELVAKHPEGPLFLNYRKRPWVRNAVRCRFRAFRKLFPQFGHFTAYSYRRAYVTDALERGLGIAHVAELVGHTSTEMIQRHYNQLQERTEHMREMANRATG
ncbi:MAG: tyrosine-type recombinase/integrase [Gemmataceae bacterium]|nr:tyrosine-type recombinase/integrase [Gemmataceae bacterium]